MEIKHKPVMATQVLGLFTQIPEKDSPVFLDGTAGEGGHALAILKKFPTAKIILADRDLKMLNRAFERLRDYSERIIPMEINYSKINLSILNSVGIEKLDGILLDLGISMYHYFGSGRGFSMNTDERLDMRLDESSISAYEIVNHYSKEKLEKIIREYGEESWAKKISESIYQARKIDAIQTAKQLADVIYHSIPSKFRRTMKIHPATKTFQAIRIAVNEELTHLHRALETLPDCLALGGIFSVIAFHSLEDRIVKNRFRELAKTDEFELIQKKAINADQDEIAINISSRSAKLRAMKRVEEKK